MSGKNYNDDSPQDKKYRSMNNLYNRFRSICLDMQGHPLARDPDPKLEQSITETFKHIQDKFHN